MGANGAGAGQANGFTALLPMIIIFAIFYFLLIRPQQKKAKEHRTMIDSLKKGDRVVTSGGIYGRVTACTDADTVTLEIADRVRVKFVRSNVSILLNDHANVPSSGRADS
ncbi:MAG: preprotein translocase subunit YajC [Candidatus Magnetomorum sp.]|nr:preprotein translocase subunit YajC [Candidatus Magnetomorum sp.]